MERKQHLQQLLDEEQEPFVLNHFINERCYLRKRSHPEKVHDSRSVFPTIKRIKSVQNSSFSDRCCLNFRSACLTASSATESPSSPFMLFLHSEHHRQPSISSSTIRNLLDTELASSYIREKQSCSANRPTESLIHSFRRSLSIRKHSSSTANLKRSSSYNLFRSIIKRLIPSKSKSFVKTRGLGKQNRKPKTGKGSCKIFEANKPSEEKNKVSFGLRFSSSSNSSAWSESDDNENMSVDLESNSSRSEDDGEFNRVEDCRVELYHDDEANTATCPSTNLEPESCFNGGDSLRTCCWQPEYQSPAASPYRRETEAAEQIFSCPNTDGSSTGDAGEAYQDKDQFSPVSVLEPPFEEDGFEHSFASVERAKQQLLGKLRRFERLAELDPLELEKRFAEEEEEEENEAKIAESLAREILNGSSCQYSCLLPPGVKKLIQDLIKEEPGDESNLDHLVQKIGQRIGDWKTVESNTIDMTVEIDLKRDANKWRSQGDQVKETAIEIEIAIFGFLLEELSFDLSRSGC